MAELDAILDQALDEFEEMELNEKADQLAKEKEGKEKVGEVDTEEDKKKSLENMQNLLSEMEDPRYGETLQNTLRSLSQTKEGGAQVDDLFQSLEDQFKQEHKPSFLPDGPDDTKGIETADREVAATLSRLAQAQKDMQGK